MAVVYLIFVLVKKNILLESKVFTNCFSKKNILLESKVFTNLYFDKLFPYLKRTHCAESKR